MSSFFNDPETEAWDRAMAELDRKFWRDFYRNNPEHRDLVDKKMVGMKK